MIGTDRAARLTAVIAEDEAFLARDLAFELDRHGIEVLALTRTEDAAVEAVLAHDPGFVVLDIDLAEGNGIDAASRLHERDGRRCVFLSGYLDGPTRQRVNALDPLAVLSKPLMISQLLDVIAHRRRVDDGPEAMEEPDRVPAVLLVEDEALIAMDLAIELEGAGLRVVGPVASLAQGLELVRENRIDIALLDINLRGERAFAIADVLLERGVPMLFLSGEDASSLPERLRRVEVVSKPANTADLAARVRALAAPASR